MSAQTLCTPLVKALVMVAGPKKLNDNNFGSACLFFFIFSPAKQLIRMVLLGKTELLTELGLIRNKKFEYILLSASSFS